MEAKWIAENFNDAGVQDDDGDVITASPWSPPGKSWARIYFRTGKRRGEGKDYGYVYCGSSDDMDMGTLAGSAAERIEEKLLAISGGGDDGGGADFVAGAGEDDIPF